MQNENPKNEATNSDLRKYYKTIKSVHKEEPDYSRPHVQISSDGRERLFSRLGFLYGDKIAEDYIAEIERILKVYYAHKPKNLIDNETSFKPTERFTEKDIILISYGDLLLGNEHSPLATLANFCDTFLERTIYKEH